MYYTDNDFRLYHSAKGSTWKNHLYSAKKNIGGKMRYIYGALGGNAKKKAKSAEADYIAKGNKWDRQVAYDARYVNDQSYEAKLKAYKDYEDSVSEYDRALWKYQETPLGRIEDGLAFFNKILKKGGDSWANTERSRLRNEPHERSKRNVIWIGDDRYARWHPDAKPFGPETEPSRIPHSKKRR